MVVDNSWVVPYNPYLMLRYEAHINIENCASPTAANYLYKYVTKGHDRAMTKAQVPGHTNEIDDYVDLRSVGSNEAAWHILSFNIAKKVPTSTSPQHPLGRPTIPGI